MKSPPVDGILGADVQHPDGYPHMRKMGGPDQVGLKRLHGDIYLVLVSEEVRLEDLGFRKNSPTLYL